MEVERRLSDIESLVVHNQNFEPERIQVLVYFAQALGEQLGYEFDIHHFKVFSEELASEVGRLRNESSSTQKLSAIAAHVTTVVDSIQLEPLNLAAANLYFEGKGYSASEIESVLNPDKQLLKGAMEVISALKMYKPKALAASGIR